MRFIYARPEEWYLKLGTKKDYIDWELDETLDINGWDLSKVLQHFHKSNATLYEWSNSPIVYYTTPEWAQIKALSLQYFSCKSAMYHYYGTANKNYLEYLTDEMVKYKKYFYVLRPILACKWIEGKACPPPVLFRELAEAVLEENMIESIEKLMQIKMQMTEPEKGRRLDELNLYIEKNLAYYKQKIKEMPDGRKEDWDALDRVFLKVIRGMNKRVFSGTARR